MEHTGEGPLSSAGAPRSVLMVIDVQQGLFGKSTPRIPHNWVTTAQKRRAIQAHPAHAT